MDNIPFRIKINSPSNYYLNDKSADIEKYINGVIINMNNINYIITSYLPTMHIDIYYDDILLTISEIYNNFLFDMTVIELKKDDVNNNKFVEQYKSSSVFYKLKSTCYKLNGKNSRPFILTNNGSIDIPWELIKYDFYTKVDFLPEQLIISIYINRSKVNGLMIGNELIKKYNNYKYLLGIVTNIEQTDDISIVKINIIPSYVINLFLKATNENKIKIKQNNIGNLWLDINDDCVITKTYNNDFFKNVNISEGSKIIKIDNRNVYNGKVYLSTIKLNVPIKTYIWYYQFEKNNKFIKINTINDTIQKTSKLFLHKIDNILTVDFYHKQIYYNKQIDDKYINIQKMSFELIDYLTSKNIYIENKLVYYLFEKPFNGKINSNIISDHNLFEDYTLFNSINKPDDKKQPSMYEFEFYQNNKKCNIDKLNKINKKNIINKSLTIKIINDDDEILTLNL
jgi:hypothetical protein